MKKDLVEMVFVLDRSGSMEGLESDTIGGFNSMITKQKETKGDAFVTTILFDDQYEVIHNRITINEVKLMTKRDYFVRGTTALLDAIGKSISNLITIYKKIETDEIPEKTIFIITTDGMENSSIEFTKSKIKKMIEFQREKYNWEFIFLGANIDAISVANNLGITKNRVANYHSDKLGTKLNYQVISDTISELRVNKCISPNWNKKINKDYEKRNK